MRVHNMQESSEQGRLPRAATSNAAHCCSRFCINSNQGGAQRTTSQLASVCCKRFPNINPSRIRRPNVRGRTRCAFIYIAALCENSFGRATRRRQVALLGLKLLQVRRRLFSTIKHATGEIKEVALTARTLAEPRAYPLGEGHFPTLFVSVD